MVDEEAKAIRAIRHQLEKLSPSGRQRVIAYLVSVADEERGNHLELLKRQADKDFESFA